jgi:hypothetical protein
MQRSGGGDAAMHVGIDGTVQPLGVDLRSPSLRREWQPIASRLVTATTLQGGPASEDSS